MMFINTVLSLFVGWVLSIFGFDAVVISGMSQLFGIAIDTLGYYFLFVLAGFISNIATRLSTKNITFGDAMKNFSDKLENKKNNIKK